MSNTKNSFNLSDFGILDGGQIRKPSNPKCSISVTEILENI